MLVHVISWSSPRFLFFWWTFLPISHTSSIWRMYSILPACSGDIPTWSSHAPCRRMDRTGEEQRQAHLLLSSSYAGLFLLSYLSLGIDILARHFRKPSFYHHERHVIMRFLTLPSCIITVFFFFIVIFKHPCVPCLCFCVACIHRYTSHFCLQHHLRLMNRASHRRVCIGRYRRSSTTLMATCSGMAMAASAPCAVIVGVDRLLLPASFRLLHRPPCRVFSSMAPPAAHRRVIAATDRFSLFLVGAGHVAVLPAAYSPPALHRCHSFLL